MKIKQTTFYALRAIHRIHLEVRNIITSSVIAGKEGLSPGVVLKVLRGLSKAGMLYAHQGRGELAGGFSLVRREEEITLLEVVDVMEKMDICSNLDEQTGEPEMALLHNCRRLNGQLREELSKYTIQDLFEM